MKFKYMSPRSVCNVKLENHWDCNILLCKEYLNLDRRHVMALRAVKKPLSSNDSFGDMLLRIYA